MASFAETQAMMKSGSWTQLRKRIFFLIGALIVFRLGSHIPIPFVDPAALSELMQSQRGTLFDIFNMFSGGSLSRLSIFTLGVMPYISASIIMQMLSYVVPTLEQLRKEGERGRRVITQYTRYAAVALAAVQALGMAVAFESQITQTGLPVIIEQGWLYRFTTVITMVTGTLFLMWLGEQITERGVGNGISILIFAGIVAGLPGALGGTFTLVSTGELSGLFVIVILVLIFIVTTFVVFCERAQRRIAIHHARQAGRGMIMGAQTTYLPLKLNMAGVIPPIFASAIILFPATAGTWFGQSSGWGWLRDIGTTLSPGQPLYILLYALAIVFFCFFYTAIVFNPKETADNLKRSGGFIPGIRPGQQTASYIDKVMSYLTVIGAGYITAVCLLPEFLILQWNVPFYFGGTSLLIIVVVAMDFMAQTQAHMMSYKYESLLKKSNLKV